MTDIAAVREELVTANRILANENVLDSFGHVSIRHPDNPGHFLLSRARAPEVIEPGDIMEFKLEGDIVGPEDEALAIHEGSYSYVTDTPDFWRRRWATGPTQPC